MWSQVGRLTAQGPVAALSWILTAVIGVSLSACPIDERRPDVSTAVVPGQPQPLGDGQPDASGPCEGPSCVAVTPEQPIVPGCLEAGCPADDACRTFDVPAGPGPDAGCLSLADCPYTWKPAAREGQACLCGDDGCLLRVGEACSAAGTCGDGGSCVATADGTSVCCARACADTEVCASDGSSCVPAEPCTGEERRCSGALHQGCVAGVWQTLTDCGALGCSPTLDSCLLSAGLACESDTDCGEGTCLATPDGSRVCCTGACNTSCQRCSALGTECVNVDDDDACGEIECPTDACRVYDPATVVTSRCRAGACATVAEACAVFEPQRIDLECSATALCDDEGACGRPKRELLSECSSAEQCATGACVATAGGTSVCCSEACAPSEVCAPTGACAPAPVCEDDDLQCSGSNFQQCVGGQWVTALACGSLGCSLRRQGCLAGAGQTCGSNADCGQGTCQETASGASICCTAACGGDCRACAVSGTACVNLQEDDACDPVSCGDFDAQCVTDSSNTLNACNGRGQCKTTADCGFRSPATRCGDGGSCNGQGVCEGPSVACGNQTCSDDVCCVALDFTTFERGVGCGDGDECNGFPGIGPGPNFRITCDEDDDCTGDDVCCMVSNNVNSGEITCRPVCTAQAVGDELGAPPEMLVVGPLCGSQAGTQACTGGLTCSPTTDTLPPDFRACR